MKAFKFIMSIVLGVLFVGLSFAVIGLGIYNLLDGVLNIEVIQRVREAIMTVIPEKHFATIAYSLLGGWGFITIMFIITTWNYPAKYTNWYIGIVKWLGALACIGLTGYVFVASGVFTTQPVEVSLNRKIGIGVMLGSYIAVRVLGSKVNQIIERKIIAYDTAMEMKQVGRQSPLWANLLKVFQFMFPEIILMGFFMFAMDASFGVYFLSIFIAVAIIVAGGIWADGNKRREAKRNILKDKVNQVRAIEQTLQGRK